MAACYEPVGNLIRRAAYGLCYLSVVSLALLGSLGGECGMTAAVDDALTDTNETVIEGGGPGAGGGPRRFAVLKSTDGGTTWTDLGTTSFEGDPMSPADPAPILQGGQLVLYFVNEDEFGGGTSGAPRIYRAVATDPITFGTPTEALASATYTYTDPVAVELADSTYRLFGSQGGWVPSGSSADGVTYTEDAGLRSNVGGVPGVIRLPGNELRLFVNGLAGGIISLTAADGLTFVQDGGTRIAVEAGDEFVGGPHPIALNGGGYLMAFKRLPSGGTSPNDDEIWLATSADGLAWTRGTEKIADGSVPALVELADGSLLLYYIDFSSVQTD